MTKQKKGLPKQIIFLIVILVVCFFGYRYYKTTQLSNFKKNIIPKAVKKAINNEKTEFTIGEVREVSGVYEFDLTINGQKYISYISKDGKLLFPSVVKLEITPTPTENTGTGQEKKLTCKDIKKTESENLTAFVVSQCPYGLQMQRVFKMAINAQPELEKNLTVRYIGAIENNQITSMHGEEEAAENLRQICIREEQKSLYWPYVACYMQAGKTEECLASTGVDITALNTCTSSNGKGLEYAKKDFTLANKFNVRGSPTLVSNNNQIVSEFDFGGRVANTIQDLVCCGSKTQANFCQNKISTDEVASSFSISDVAGAQDSSPNSNCN